MFLNQLSLIEKENFISLAVNAAEANGVFAKEEYSMIEQYCKEMGIAFFDSKNIKSLDKVIEVFKESDEKVKKIITLETIGLLYSDGDFDEEEKFFLKTLYERIGVDKSVIDTQIDLIAKYSKLIKDIEKNLS